MPTAISGALLPVLTGVMALVNVSSFRTLSSGGIYNYVPESSAFPYTSIGDATEAPFAAFGNHGATCTVVLRFYSQYKGDLQSAQLASAARVLLDQQTLTVVGYLSAFIEHELTQTIEEPPIAGVRTRYLASTYRIDVLPV